MPRSNASSKRVFFTEPSDDKDGVDFERVIPVPKIDYSHDRFGWPECSSSVDEALVVLGRAELQCMRRYGSGPEETVDDLIKRAWERPSPRGGSTQELKFGNGDIAFTAAEYGLDFVQELQIRDVETFRAEYIRRCPHNVAQARLAISAHAETGFANSLDWTIANWGTKWHPRYSTHSIDKQGAAISSISRPRGRLLSRCLKRSLPYSLR